MSYIAYKVVEADPDQWGDRHASVVRITTGRTVNLVWYLIESSDGDLRARCGTRAGCNVTLSTVFGFHNPVYIKDYEWS